MPASSTVLPAPKLNEEVGSTRRGVPIAND